MEQQPPPPPHVQEKSAGDHVLKTPLWVVVVRGFQILISVIILGLCADLMHDAYIAEEGFSLAVALFTWVGVAYILLTEKVSSLHSAYHIVAVLVIDGLLMILWLAAFASMAALRASYVYDVTVGDCSDDGSLLDSKTCTTTRRSLEHLEKRNNVILFKSGLAMTAAIAGLGALMWLLFIASFVWTLLMFLRGRKQGRFALSSTSPASPSNNYQMENKVAESTPMSPQTYPSQTQPQPPPVAFHETQSQYQQPPVQHQQQQGYAPQGQPYQQPQSPYQQQQGYPPPQEQQNFGQYPPQQQHQQQPYQQPVQPQVTGQSQPVSTAYGSELDGQSPYHGHPPVSPPPQQYQQPYPPQN
ncbi:hypothetical protein AK830_g3573 [Neonectria ditissima]|uniref:MARVEL domain-containing protein n=1 Tax=Neonectria ditissima TaxID=78410 RepID=A0A0P7BNQ0_9HYPO|nr:hypothetical protein AK830_g3573 [Neonectria ditissima]